MPPSRRPNSVPKACRTSPPSWVSTPRPSDRGRRISATCPKCPPNATGKKGRPEEEDSLDAESRRKLPDGPAGAHGRQSDPGGIDLDRPHTHGHRRPPEPTGHRGQLPCRRAVAGTRGLPPPPSPEILSHGGEPGPRRPVPEPGPAEAGVPGLA